ncbi:hypothetical protein H101_08094, partial [Trichophyton interdigitale H6]
MGTAVHLLQEMRVDGLGHAVKVDEQADEDLVGGRAVLVDAAEVVEDGDAGHILAVKGQHAGCLRRQRALLRPGDVPVQVFVLAVVGRGDLGEQAGDHLDHVGHGHRADL